MDPADLKRLCEVSKPLYEAVTPRLYKSVRLSTTELSLARLESQLENILFAHLKHTRHIHLRAPFYKRLESRCLHHDYPQLSDMATLRQVDELDEHASENVSRRAIRSLHTGRIGAQMTDTSKG